MATSIEAKRLISADEIRRMLEVMDTQMPAHGGKSSRRHGSTRTFVRWSPEAFRSMAGANDVAPSSDSIAELTGLKVSAEFAEEDERYLRLASLEQTLSLPK